MRNTPKCCDCKDDFPLLYSITRKNAKGEQVSEALCLACFNVEAVKQEVSDRVTGGEKR